MNLWQRYTNDPAFYQLVRLMLAEIERGQFTPTEIREAAMLAQIDYESRHPRPIIFSREDVMRWKSEADTSTEGKDADKEQGE